MPDRTACRRAEHAVSPGQVTGHATRRRTLQAAVAPTCTGASIAPTAIAVATDSSTFFIEYVSRADHVNEATRECR